MAIDITFEKYTLSNGLDVVLHVDKSIPVAAVNVWYHVGSQNEEPDRTGFAHLFEHLMFEGSKNHNREYFHPLQEVGANINGSTSNDRTNYYENVPAEYLELALWLESDRMGYLLDAVDQHRLDVQRDVVKNERRQSYENRPYGLAGQEIRKALFPPSHPYHWQTIGSQEHLDAAALEDVHNFFKRFYAPNNASLSIAGDIDVDETKKLVERYFGDLTPAPAVARLQRWTPQLDSEVRLQLEDRVQLERVFFAWVGPPRFDADEAALDVLVSILAEGRSSRLHRSLVYEKQIARDVNAYFAAMEIAGEIRIDATVVPGKSVAEVEEGIFDELTKIQDAPPSDEEVQRAVNRIEAHYVRQLESVGGFGGRADLLNYFNVFAGDPGQLNQDLNRYLRVTPADVQRVAKQYFGPGRVRLLITPLKQVTAGSSEVDRTQQPGAGRTRSFEPPVPQRLTVAGKYDLLVVEKREVPLVAAGVYFPGGSVLDPADKPGLTAFMGRLMTEGTRNRSSMDIADEGDFIAARPAVGVDREDIIISTEALTRHWPKALELLADVLLNPTFPENEVDRVRRERLTDLRRLKDDANAIADRVENGLLYGRDTPHGHPISGREESVEAFTRDEVVQQHQRLILEGKPTFFVVGDIDAATATQQLEDAFGAHPFKDSAPAPATIDATRQATTIYLVDKPGAAQSVISASQLSVERTHADYVPLVVMNMVFGGQFTSRLNMNLREDKGYTYGYRSRFDWRQTNSGYSAGGAVQTAVTKESLIETLKEFRELHADKPVTADEFERARLGIIRGFPPSFETPGQVLRRLLDLVHYGLPDDYFSHHVSRLTNVSLEDVHRVSAGHVDPSMLSIIVVGDRKVIEPGLLELNLPIVHLDYEGRPLE
ncbi:MAG: M16 family metallopeptidase [Dehalococcoidia bacterium]